MKLANYVNRPPINSTKTVDTSFVVGRTDGSFEEVVLPLTVVEHGAVAGTTRPDGAKVVYWIGSVEPTNGAAQDLWYDTTA